MRLAEEKGKGLLALPRLHKEWSAEGFSWLQSQTSNSQREQGAGREGMLCPPHSSLLGKSETHFTEERGWENVGGGTKLKKHEQVNHPRPPPHPAWAPRTKEGS